jgi:ureidoglycolate amidohydrolase
MNLTVNQNRLARELDELGAISSEPSPAVTRVVFTEADQQGRRFVIDLCRQAGLSIRIDPVGNTFARWAGSEPGLPAVGTGSHIDALPNAGRFDGPVGVLGGLEAIRALQAAGVTPRRSLELLIFTSEEPTRFGLGCLGSRLLSGALPPTAGETFHDPEGLSLNQVRQAAGFPGDLSDVRLPPNYYSAFVELHIEQGPLLEREGLQLGIVTAIAAPATLRIQLEGEGGHAGALLMPDRRDAFLAAAEIALAVEAAAKSTGVVDTVATTGICDIFPRAVNSVPSRARMELDIRDIDGIRRDHVLGQVIAAAQEITARRRITLHHELLNADPPAQCDPAITATLESACNAHQATYRRMISRAYHDSLFMAQLAPTAMLFIPCRAGVSHRPDEYSSPEAIAQGTLILAETLYRLSSAGPCPVP